MTRHFVGKKRVAEWGWGEITVKDILLGQLISNFGVPEKTPGYAPDINAAFQETVS